MHDRWSSLIFIIHILELKHLIGFKSSMVLAMHCTARSDALCIPFIINERACTTYITRPCPGYLLHDKW